MKPKIVTQLMTESTENKYRITFYDIREFNKKLMNAPNRKMSPTDLFRYAMITCPEQELNIVAETQELAVEKFRQEFPEQHFEIIEIAEYIKADSNRI